MLLRTLLIFAVLVGCGQKTGGRGRITVAQDISHIVSLDPAEAYDILGTEIIFDVYRRLFTNINGVFRKDLLKHYEFLQGGRLLRLSLKTNQSFASGNPVTANDVVYSLQRVIFLQKKASCMLAALGLNCDNIRRLVRYVDEYTVEIMLPKKIEEHLVLSCLSSAAASIVDSEVLKKHTQDDDYGHKWLRSSYAGGGPLMLGVWTPHELIILKKNKYYTGFAKVRFTALIIHHISDPASRLAMLHNGEVDMIRGVPSEYLATLCRKKYQIAKTQSGTMWYLNLNQKNQYLRNPDVQKAIRMLVRHSDIIDAFGENLAVELHTIIPPGFEGYRNDLQHPPYNAEAARALIHAAYGKNIELEIDVPHLAAGRAIQKAFAKGGIDLRINYHDNARIIQRLQARNHQISLKYFAPDFANPHTFFSMFVADPGLVSWRNSINTSGLKEKLRRMTRAEKEERLRLYAEIQERFFEKPVIVLAQTFDATVAGRNIKGLGTMCEMTAMHQHTLEKGS